MVSGKTRILLVFLLTLMGVVAAASAFWNHYQLLEIKAHLETLASGPMCGFSFIGTTLFARLHSLLAASAFALAIGVAAGDLRALQRSLLAVSALFGWYGVATGWPPIRLVEFSTGYVSFACFSTFVAIALGSPSAPRRVLSWKI